MSVRDVFKHAEDIQGADSLVMHGQSAVAAPS